MFWSEEEEEEEEEDEEEEEEEESLGRVSWTDVRLTTTRMTTH